MGPFSLDTLPNDFKGNSGLGCYFGGQGASLARSR